MKILKTRTMRGPNYWSANHNQLLVLQLEIDPAELLSPKQLEETGIRFSNLKPSLHNLSPYPSMAHLVAQIALEIQCLAGMDCAYSEIKPLVPPFTFNVLFSYTLEQAGKYAAGAAVSIVQALIEGAPYDLEKDIKVLKQIKRKDALGPSTQGIADEARKWNIPVVRLNQGSLLQLGYGSRQQIMRATIAGTTSYIAVETASDKERTKDILKKGYIPVPEGSVADTEDELDNIMDELGFPLTIKPLDANHGRGITTNIRSAEELKRAFSYAKQISDDVIIERHIQGMDYRLLVINYQLNAVALRKPAEVIGDGFSTIKELVDKTNQDPRRGDGHENVLTKIHIDAATKSVLAKQQLTEQSVLPQGVSLQLKLTANLSTGGTSEDVTDIVHPHNKFLAERAARLMGLDICGIDVIAEDISVPITERNGAILEINAAPGLRMHQSPSAGTPRNPAAAIIDFLFPQKTKSRIPIVAVTGTNGKTTTTRLIANLMKQAGQRVGYTTTDGIYIQEQLVTLGDCSGPESAAVILRDPTVNFAVLECARGGILRAGLGFEQADVGVVTNISGDHLGMDGIETIGQLAKVKFVVPRSVHKQGYAVLNADDDLVYQMKEELECKIALFSLNALQPRIIEHCNNGYPAAFLDQGYFTIFNGTDKIPVAKIEDVPLTHQGKSECMIKNVLPAIITAFICNVDIDVIIKTLLQFEPSPENIPGRMNLFDFGDFNVIIDYMHNEDGYREMKKYIAHIETSTKVGIIAAVPDRPDQDMIIMGRQAAEIFDEIIIRHDVDNRGRKNEEISELLINGIRQVNRDLPVLIISDEFEAIEYAIDHAKQGSWLFINTENAYDTIDFVQQKKSTYLNKVVL